MRNNGRPVVTYRILMVVSDDPEPIVLESNRSRQQAVRFLDNIELAWKRLNKVERTETSVEIPGTKVYIEEEPNEEKQEG